MSHSEFMMTSPVIVNTRQQSTVAGTSQNVDFENIWTYDGPAEVGDFIYTDVIEQPGHAHCTSNDINLADFDAQDLSQLHLLDPIMTKYENDVISPDSAEVVMPDSQTQHVTSTAHSPYTDFNQQLSPVSYPTSSPTVPSSTPYSGDYSFEVSVQKQPKETKSATWTHSETLGKLYVRLGAACPFVYRTNRNRTPPSGCVVRVLPVYIRPEHVRDVVRRCPNHVAGALRDSSDTEAAVQAQHLIHSQHSMARYLEDPNTRRLSVVVPFEQPQAGADWVTSLLEFHCFSSCVGGLNRRPVQVIFTLEDVHGNVLGRRALEVRVCACPGRDRSADERAALDGGSRRSSAGGAAAAGTAAAPGGLSAGVKRSAAVMALDEACFAAEDAKRNRLSDDGDVFTLKVRGRRSYDILCTLRDCLELSSFLSPQLCGQYQARQAELHQRLSMFNGPADDSKPISVLPPAAKTANQRGNNSSSSSNNNNNKTTSAATTSRAAHFVTSQQQLQQQVTCSTLPQYRNSQLTTPTSFYSSSN